MTRTLTVIAFVAGLAAPALADTTSTGSDDAPPPDSSAHSSTSSDTGSSSSGSSSSGNSSIQKSGPQVFPGKFQVGAHIIGGQFGFTGFEASGFRLQADFAGRVKDFDKFSLWVGGGFHYVAGGIYACVGCGGFQNELGFWGFVEFSLEKLMNKIPLVPYVRGGLDGGLLYYGAAGGYFAIRLQAGIHYWITKNIGLGGEAAFDMGAGFYPGALGTGFYGTVDFELGARFAF